MERSERGSIILDLDEAEVVRAALVTLEHYMKNVWDRDEIRAVSGFTVERFASVRRSMDEAREAGDQDS